MLRRNDSRTLVGLAAALTLVAGTAFAQANPELGETGGSASVGGTAAASTETGASAQTTGTWQPPTGGQTAAASEPAADTTTEEAAPGDTDHQSVVGRFGVGLFGAMAVPAMGCTFGAGGCTPDSAGSVSAPVIGVRYWLDAGMGIEVGLGLGIESSGTETTTTGAGGGTTETNGPSMLAFGLHGGLPLVFAESQHFAFELVPELNFGFATGSWDDTVGTADVDLSGLMFQLGARVGAEIQFGFIDIPQLSLQGTVGMHLGLESRSASNSGGEFTASSFRFGTTLQGEPWDIFTGALTAIYYF